MAEGQESLKESPLDRALSQSRGTFDPETVQATPDGLIGGHPAQEEEVEEEEEDGGLPPTEPVVPPPVVPPPPVVDPAAEQRRLEAEHRMRLSMQETDALRADRDRLQREAEELRQQVARTESVTPQETPDLSAIRTKLTQKLREVWSIDDKLADYWDRLGAGYADALDPFIEAKASAVFQQLSPNQQAAMRQALLKDPEFLDAIKASVVPEVQTQVNANTENARVFNYVVDQAKAAGFDIGGEATPGFRSLPMEQQAAAKAEADLFWNVAVAYADNQFPQGTTEQRTAEALETMRRLKGVSAPAAPTPPATPPRPVRQPMGRQSAGPAPTGGTTETPVTPISLEDAVRAAENGRRI